VAPKHVATGPHTRYPAISPLAPERTASGPQ